MVIFAFCPANVFKPDKMVMQTYVQVNICIVIVIDKNITTVNNTVTFGAIIIVNNIVMIIVTTAITGGQAKGQPERTV